MPQQGTLARVLARFGLTAVGIRRDLIIAGSPERSLYRVVAETDAGPFVVESVAPEMAARKREIAATIRGLADAGLSRLAPYRRDATGSHLVAEAGDYWQVTPYLAGRELPRPEWVDDGWRGAAMAAFLVAMRSVTDGAAALDGLPPFSIVGYIGELLAQVRAHHDELIQPLDAILRYLAPLRDRAQDDDVDLAFCHGDYHPLNVIWGDRGIRAVIDWEFCGRKPGLYDAATLVGCVGIEDPGALTGEFVHEFLDGLRADAAYGRDDWSLFHHLVVAIRFAWLSEWLRKHDADMIALELDYLRLLVQDAGLLRDDWGVG